MIAHATGEILVIADSDMRVTPDYLDAVVARRSPTSASARRRASTAANRPADDLASALGAMWITEQFAPSALVANALEPLTYCFGGTMAVRRNVFEAIGGLAALGNQLADDATLGRLVAERGYRVALASYVVDERRREAGLRGLAASTSCAGRARSARSGPRAMPDLPDLPDSARAGVRCARSRPATSYRLGALAVLVRLGLHCATLSLSRSERRPP